VEVMRATLTLTHTHTHTHTHARTHLEVVDSDHERLALCIRSRRLLPRNSNLLWVCVVCRCVLGLP
jgi:hypothetical protein